MTYKISVVRQDEIPNRRLMFLSHLFREASLRSFCPPAIASLELARALQEGHIYTVKILTLIVNIKTPNRCFFISKYVRDLFLRIFIRNEIVGVWGRTPSASS